MSSNRQALSNPIGLNNNILFISKQRRGTFLSEMRLRIWREFVLNERVCVLALFLCIILSGFLTLLATNRGGAIFITSSKNRFFIWSSSKTSSNTGICSLIFWYTPMIWKKSFVTIQRVLTTFLSRLNELVFKEDFVSIPQPGLNHLKMEFSFWLLKECVSLSSFPPNKMCIKPIDTDVFLSGLIKK